MWLDQTGRAILVGGNPRRGSVQPLVERFEPWYLDVADRPQLTAAPAAIGHNQPFTTQVQLAPGTTLKHLRLFRLTSTTHQVSAAESDFTLTALISPTGPGWSLTNSPNLTPPGYDYLVAVDSRDVPQKPGSSRSPDLGTLKWRAGHGTRHGGCLGQGLRTEGGRGAGRRPLLEVVHRITPVAHHVGHQHVGLAEWPRPDRRRRTWTQGRGTFGMRSGRKGPNRC
jgi:hypothetical protein